MNTSEIDRISQVLRDNNTLLRLVRETLVLSDLDQRLCGQIKMNDAAISDMSWSAHPDKMGS